MTDFVFETNPPEAVTNFLRNKELLPTIGYRDLAAQEHAFAFTVARSTGFDILGDIRGALVTALEEGKTFAQFQAELEPLLARKGWTGFTLGGDGVSGENDLIELGTPRRLRTIFDANMRSARAAGAWERTQRNKAFLPYLIYTLGPSEEHRPHHADKEGLILPVDHPFWRVWYFPNGWGCKCGARAISAREAQRLGGVSDEPDVPDVQVRNRETGEIRTVPQGVDPEWASNPGLERQDNLRRTLFARQSVTRPDLTETMVRVGFADLRSRPFMQSFLRGELTDDPRVSLPVAVLPERFRDLAGHEGTVIGWTGRSAARHNPSVEINYPDAKEWDLLQLLIDQGTGWIQTGPTGKRWINFILYHEGRWLHATLTSLPKRAELWLNTFKRRSPDPARPPRPSQTHRRGPGERFDIGEG
ncbi:phage minor head protein [Algimonas porphyrae]|uniref:Phage head morphogenesis domain-containing protein n=1 Tax=Algimonas porphyrae TaxID=1128113 RepID=A0ABQ5V1P1_9PROT|nr:phage minor head protein [Algimonas porphyrae]GLQ20496.1 hypothetical protein GCM10007854_14510 [Algimonas porphyrae]